MIAHHFSQIEEITDLPGAQGATKRTLIGRDHGAAAFYMRRFTLAPGGATPRHSHAWEHQIYVLAGNGRVHVGGEETALSEGMAVFIPPAVEHQLLAGDETLAFICMIPAVDEG